MLNVQVIGDKIVIEGLNSLAESVPKAIDRGLVRIAKGIHREAFGLLSGPGRKAVLLRKVVSWLYDESGPNKKTKNATRARGQFDSLDARPGSMPVPVMTGNLRRLLDWLRPGESKSGPAGSFTAGQHEVVVFDSAQYAGTIHEGRGSSAKFGPRRFLIDGFNRFNEGIGVANVLEEEIGVELNKLGGRA